MYKASVILTTYNRNDECIYCLDRLLHLYDLEIILMDEWHIENPSLSDYCTWKNIKYVWSGSQKSGKVTWRVPGYAFNIGVKLCSEDYVIIGGAEIYHKDPVFYSMVDSKCASAPTVLDQKSKGENVYTKLNNKLPFCFGLPKKTYLSIGGYDEDFTGYCFDDNDFSDRVLKVEQFKEVEGEVIHLWNPRGSSSKNDPKINKSSWDYNRRIYEERKGMVVRNENKNWGIL